MSERDNKKDQPIFSKASPPHRAARPPILELVRLRLAWREARHEVRVEFLDELSVDERSELGTLLTSQLVARARTFALGERREKVVPWGISHVEAFVDSVCLRMESSSEKASDIAKYYDQWREFHGQLKMSAILIGRCLQSLGFPKRKSSNIFYVGIRICREHPRLTSLAKRR
jgi:hypothetical protein